MLELFGQNLLVEPCKDDSSFIATRKKYSVGIVKKAGEDTIAKVGDKVSYTGEKHPLVEGLVLLTENRTVIVIEHKIDDHE